MSETNNGPESGAENRAHGAPAHHTGTPARDAEWDVVVVGAGAAGLNAALVLARARRRVAVIDLVAEEVEQEVAEHRASAGTSR